MQTSRQTDRDKQAVYQSRSGDRLFGAGDYIGLVVDLEGQSGQTGDRHRVRAEVTRLSVSKVRLVAAAVEGKPSKVFPFRSEWKGLLKRRLVMSEAR